MPTFYAYLSIAEIISNPVLSKEVPLRLVSQVSHLLPASQGVL